MPDIIAAKLKSAPNGPGVYIIRDAASQPIYIGKAEALRKRLQQHFREAGGGPWHEVMIRHAADFDYILTRSPVEALLLEATLIKQHKPRFNIRLIDDKSFPYLMLTEEKYPRLTLLRDLPPQARPGGGRPVARGLHDPQRHRVHRLDEGDVFGPYSDAKAMRRTMHLVSGLFGLRTCRLPLTGAPVGKPCLNFHLHRCLGPCRGAVPEEEYREAVRQVRRFLKGQSGQVEADLRRQMEAASAALDFERAAAIRDRLQSLQRALRDQVVVSTRRVEQDVAAVASAEDTAVVALLRIRHGRLIGQEEYPLREVRQHSPAEMLEAFLTQHYSGAQWAPRELLLSVPVEAPAAWESLLSGLRGGPVTVRVPERGAGRRLLEIARRNAEAALVRALQVRQRREGTLLALEDLQILAALPRLPERIEGYDISNVSGDHATASMVVFSQGQPDKSSYRRFRIRTPGPDDYAMLAEALRRRLQRLAEGDPKFLPAPDLILVDGGLGQVSAARRVLGEAGLPDLPLLGLAKQEEQVFSAVDANPLPTAEHRSAWYLLQRVRDEAHRFAKSYHLGLRDAAMTRSELDSVPGLGPRRRQALMRAFPSLHEMARASEAELAAVPAMNATVARALQAHLAEWSAAKV